MARGATDLNVIRWDKPDRAFRDSLRGMKRLTWPISGNAGEAHTTYAELGNWTFAVAEEMENVMGFELDDFFVSTNDTPTFVRTPDGISAVCPTRFPYGDLVELKRRMERFSRPLELRLVFYDDLLKERKDPRDLKPIIDVVDSVTYWVWCADNIERLEETFAAYRELAPEKPTYMGVYLWDFGGARPMPLDLLRRQLELGLGWFRKGEIEGFVFLCSSICNRPYPAVDFCRRWLAKHGDAKWGSRNRPGRAVPVETAHATVDLSGRWRLSGMDESGNEIQCPIVVPGDVQTALLTANAMVDPFYGNNEIRTQWVGRHDWTVSRSFEAGAEIHDKKAVVLRLEDVDTFATIRVNGRVVGKCDNRFCRWEFDIKPFLRSGENEISGHFESPERKSDELAEKYGVHVFPMCCVPWAKNQSMVRKPACHGGWDWGIAQETIGFCGSVAIFAYDDFKVDYISSTQTFNDDMSRCDLDVSVDATDADGMAFTVTNRFTVDNPPLWWPNGAGERKFFNCVLDVRGRKIAKRIGLRKLEVLSHPDRLADGREGYRLAFMVNGRELFMKGANWVPCNAFADATTPGRVRDLLESAAAANMNMLRVWGGGQYETDSFYDICDELGLLVWQDFMFACAAYPGDGAFLESVRGEFRHQVKRLRDHAALALWCGDNECIGAPTAWPETEREAEYHRAAMRARHQAAREAVARFDPDRHFWLSSPSPGGGKYAAEPNQWDTDAKGDMHNWQVWHENKDFEEYYKTRPRFCSEFGFQSFSSREVAETYCQAAELNPTAPDFEYHQKNDGGTERILATMTRYFRFPQGTDAMLYLSQVQQAVAVKTSVEWYRSLRPHCMGALYWQLDDNWPVTSWSSIEYGGKWKPLHYLARRFYAPLSVMALPGERIVALNDLPEAVSAEIAAEYWSFDGRILAVDRWMAVLPPDSSTDVGTWSKRENAFVLLTLKSPRGNFANEWFFDAYKACTLAAAKVSMACEDLSVTLSTDFPAFFVWVNARGVRGEFSDNCFALLPGRPKVLSFRPKGGSVSADDFKRSLSVTHLSETYMSGRTGHGSPTD